MAISSTSALDLRESEPALLKLLDELNGFERTQKLDNRFNLFTAIDMVNREVKHTKFLAFLLDPLESHGLGERFLRRLLAAIASDHPSAQLSRLDVAISDLGSVAVHSERDHFDISIEIPGLGALVVIENKVDAPEGEDQLAKYRNRAEDRYPNLQFVGAFLTPEGYKGMTNSGEL